MKNEAVAGRTQRKATAGTYIKLARLIGQNRKVLDYGAGLCHGAAILGAESFEPNPKPGVVPTYTKQEDISDVYDVVVCNCVLNVVPEEGTRKSIILHILSLLKPKGYALIMVRSRADVATIKHATADGDGVRTSTGSFQRGFSFEELAALVPEGVRAERLRGIFSVGMILTTTRSVIY